MERQKEPSASRRYLLALLAPAVVAGVMQLTWPFFEPNPASLYLLAVMIASWYGGLGPGLLSLLVSFLLADYFFIEPYFRLGMPGRGNLVRLVILATVGPFISVLSELLHRERRRAEINFDVTKRAEEALRESEKRFRLIAETITEVFWIADINIQTMVYVSPAYERIWGRSRESLYKSPRSFLDAVHSEDRERVLADLEVKKAGQRFDHEYRIIRPDGMVRWIWDRGFPVQNESEEVTHFVGIAQDITERKLTEEALRQTEQKYENIVENAVEGIFQTTPDGRFITANPALANMLGFESPADLISSRTDIDQQHYVQPERRTEFKRLLDEQDVVQDYEFEAYRKDGSKIWTSENVRSVHDDSGKLLYYEGTAEDITERKQAEEALRRSEMDLADFFENAAMGLHWVSPDGTILRINQAELDLLGYTRVECIGHQIAEFHVDSDVIEDILERLQAGEVLRDFEARLRCMDGSIKYVLINSSVYWEEGKFVHTRCFTRDITERKRAEESLRESEERYRDLVENSRELICTHDLNGLVLSANPAAAAAIGYDLDEYVGKKTIRDLLAPEVRHQFDQYMARLRKERTTSGIMLVQTKSGERRVWEYYNSLRTEGVAAPVVRGMAHDITEQRHAEKAMSDLRRELELTMNSMEEGVHRVDLKGNIAYENPAAAHMLGWEAAELLGRPAHSTMHHTRQDGTPYPTEECPIYATFRDGISRKVADEVFWRQDGTSFPVEYMTAPMRDDRDEIVAAVVTFQDITERKRAEETLREAHARIESVLASVADTHILFDRQWRYLYVNEAAVRAIGRPREELLERTLWEVYPDIVGTELDRQYRRAMDERIPVAFEFHYLAEDTWWENHFYPAPEGLAIFATNITERKRAEEALKQSEVQLAEAQNLAHVGSWNWDIQSKSLTWSDELYRIYGYQPRDFSPTYESFLERVHPEDRDSVARSVEESLRTHETFSNQERIIRPDGEERVLHSHGNVVCDALGNPVRMFGVCQDITEHKRAEAALRESYSLLHTVVEEIPDAVFVKDLGGRYQLMNSPGARILGKSVDEIIGGDDSQLFPREAALEIMRRDRHIITTGETQTFEHTVNADGITRTYLTTKSVYRDSQGDPIGVIGIARDITEHKQTEKALQTFSRRLIEAQEAERHSIARELHDEIGQVLTAVKMNLEAVQRSCDVNAALPRVEESIVIVDAALGQVRELSLNLRPSLLDDLGLDAALRWYVDRYARRTTIVADLVSDYEDGDRLPHEFETACFRIAQEALTNVARHAQASRVTVCLQRSSGQLGLTIKDDGVGFDVGHSLKSASSASALGLRGMEERALTVGGRIEIDSAPGKGTVVRAIFPLRRKK